MNFTHYDLKLCKQGQKVEVTLQGNTANVILIDDANFQNYKNGGKYQAYGGHMTSSVSLLQVPHSGHWHVVIDRGGFSGTVQSSIRLL
ncbi:hypothetical protein VIM7927_00072 [Vibrio mangrovi]|nr:hypothetical protein VIM7927_00072 [Vibrio mangrovi]